MDDYSRSCKEWEQLIREDRNALQHVMDVTERGFELVAGFAMGWQHHGNKLSANFGAEEMEDMLESEDSLDKFDIGVHPRRTDFLEIASVDRQSPEWARLSSGYEIIMEDGAFDDGDEVEANLPCNCAPLNAGDNDDNDEGGVGLAAHSISEDVVRRLDERRNNATEANGVYMENSMNENLGANATVLTIVESGVRVGLDDHTQDSDNDNDSDGSKDDQTQTRTRAKTLQQAMGVSFMFDGDPTRALHGHLDHDIRSGKRRFQGKAQGRYGPFHLSMNCFSTSTVTLGVF